MPSPSIARAQHARGVGLGAGEASVVIPMANMSFVVAVLIAAASGMEKITLRKLLAVASAAVAITLLTGA